MLIDLDLIMTVRITVIQLNNGLNKYLLMKCKARFPRPRGRLFRLPQDSVSWGGVLGGGGEIIVRQLGALQPRAPSPLSGPRRLGVSPGGKEEVSKWRHISFSSLACRPRRLCGL